MIRRRCKDSREVCQECGEGLISRRLLQSILWWMYGFTWIHDGEWKIAEQKSSIGVVLHTVILEHMESV
jgi:hypothetical protein